MPAATDLIVFWLVTWCLMSVRTTCCSDKGSQGLPKLVLSYVSQVTDQIRNTDQKEKGKPMVELKGYLEEVR